MKGEKSAPVTVMSGVSQGTVLGPLSDMGVKIYSTPTLRFSIRASALFFHATEPLLHATETVDKPLPDGLDGIACTSYHIFTKMPLFSRAKM